jgi:hypothetical protein
MNGVARLLMAFFLVGSILGANGLAEPPRLVCLVSATKGQVLFSPTDGPKKPLEIFTRLREGERLELARDSEVQLAFLQKGVRETWTGPATVLITGDGGQSPDGPSVPVTDKLPTRSRPTGTGSSILTQAGEQTTAQILTRDVVLPEDQPLSDEDKARLAEVEQDVVRMRQAAAPGDAGPDIVLLEELSRLGQRRRLSEELQRLRDAYPDNAALAHWGE